MGALYFNERAEWDYTRIFLPFILYFYEVMMKTLSELREKLRIYNKRDIVVTYHANIQAYVREIDIEEVKENIVCPDKLVYFEAQGYYKGNEKLNCYFAYEKNMFHRYVLTLNAKIIIVTIIKINRDWQRAIERK